MFDGVAQAVAVLPGNRIMLIGGEGHYDNNATYKYPKHVNEVCIVPPPHCKLKDLVVCCLHILTTSFKFRRCSGHELGASK